MNYVLAVLFVGAGLFSLLAPRGSGREHSDTHYLLRRLGSIVWFAAAVGLVWPPLVDAADAERERRYEAAWDVTVESWMRFRDVEVRTGVPVFTHATSARVTAPEGTVAVHRYGVVGSDALDPQLPVKDARDGDLVVQIFPHWCEADRLVVDEDGTTVRLSVVAAPSEGDSPGLRDTIGSTGERCANPGMRLPGLDTTSMDDILIDRESVEYVHVPLDRPLEGRRVIDASTGTDVPAVATVPDAR